MELENMNNKNSSDPTPKLKSSPMPILFVSFNENDENCFNCGDKYITTYFYDQKYCKKCLTRYITEISNNNTHLDMRICTMDLKCSEHRDKEFLIQDVREWCENCSGVLYFKQIFANYCDNYYFKHDRIIRNRELEKSERDCKLCGKFVYQQNDQNQNNENLLFKFKACSNCYQISFDWIKSTLTKKLIPILYLPWWVNKYGCIACYSELKFTSDCQKHCSNCCIVYTGCRNCLTTNIIFGLTADHQSQCKKCKKFITIDANIDSDDFLFSSMFNMHNLRLAEIINDVMKTDDPIEIYRFIDNRHNQTSSTLKLQSSSSTPIFFISFNENDWNCFHCGEKYTWSYYQRYCKKCLSHYFTAEVTDINANIYEYMCEHETNGNICLDCYQISGWIESTLTKKPIPILYLPWWDNKSSCIACDSNLKFTSNCQKHCSNCCIVYIGCRYCLTTNIIFGFTAKSQCKKCKKFITIDTDISGNFLYNSIFNFYDLYNYYIHQLAKIIDDFKKINYPEDRYRFVIDIKHNTLKLRSGNNDTPIWFVSFNQVDRKCFHCGDEYFQVPNYPRYCKRCLLTYFTDDITDISAFLDMNICGHKMNSDNSICSDCYQISSGLVRSTFTKKCIPILYLPWWDNENSCIACNSKLKFISNCQKYCSNGCVIYTGCRYCLTTNIIFGYTTQSQCKKCKGFITIDTNISDDFFYNSMFNYILRLSALIDKIKDPEEMYRYIGRKAMRNTDPTNLRLKSSCTTRIWFVSFTQDNRKCFYCEDDYVRAIHDQKYCKECLLRYRTSITDIHAYFDANICEHEVNNKKCLDCYQISSGWIESTLIKKPIPILYLPWWDSEDKCIACDSKLKLTSNCQKNCVSCCIIYTGCRYCLTTNIIFGLTAEQSQCKKCKRFIAIDVNIYSDDFLYNLMFNMFNIHNLQLAKIIDDVKETGNPIDIYIFIGKEYEKCNTNPKNPLRLKSSSNIQISFVSFNQDDSKCFHCGEEYTWLHFQQYYCKECLLHYFTDINKYLDTNICEHEMNSNKCLDCYQISSGWIESTLIRKLIPILYLSWWDNKSRCIACDSNLKFPSDCQKYCPNCCIVYTGCRYCLTTNIIFGFTAQSQCEKCKEIITIDEDVKNYFLYNLMFNLNSNYILLLDEIIDNIKKTNNNPMDVYRFIRKIYEICNTNPTNTTLKLKSSSIKPILFVPFKQNNWKCFHCGDEYVQTNYNQKKYCKKCLSCYITYITNITDINAFIDANVCEHEVGSVKCLDCFQISSEWVKSTLIKKQILILYLSWWDKNNNCIACGLDLKLTSECQKYCTHCHIIYAGCRYCLTTNIIFGFINQSQCKKCKKVLLITIDANNSSGNSDLDDFLYDQRSNFYDGLQLDEIISKKFDDNPMEIYDIINRKFIKIQPKPMMEWIPYSQITNMKQIAEGGFGIIYQATWLDGSLHINSSDYDIDYFTRNKHERIIIKKMKNSQDITKYFLNELKSNQDCFKFKHHVIRFYGFTKDPESNDYILVMQCASEGDLHKYLQRNFKEIKWNKDKLRILYQISDGLETIHKANFIHRDFHSGNILFDLRNGKRHQCQIGDLGLSQPANALSNNEIYGVIPYVAPEIFNGSAFSKESDVYSFGMVMWELTTGCKPLVNDEYSGALICQIVDGKRPEITDDTPECFANLMRSCWDPDPKKRPSIMEIRKTFYQWFHRSEDKEQFERAEIKRKKLIKSKKLGPEFTAKPHSKATYTSKLLSSLISKALSINSSATSTHNMQDYISKEIDFDINIQSSNLQNLNTIFQSSSTTRHSNAIYTSRPLSELISTATSRKRQIEESNIETDDNKKGKYIKTDGNLNKK